jgi:hypothetical protein
MARHGLSGVLAPAPSGTPDRRRWLPKTGAEGAWLRCARPDSSPGADVLWPGPRAMHIQCTWLQESPRSGGNRPGRRPRSGAVSGVRPQATGGAPVREEVVGSNPATPTSTRAGPTGPAFVVSRVGPAASPCLGPCHAEPCQDSRRSVQRLLPGEQALDVDGSTKTPGDTSPHRPGAVPVPRVESRYLGGTGRSRATRRGGGSTTAAERATSTTCPADTSSACTSPSSSNLGSLSAGMSGSSVSVPMVESGGDVSMDWSRGEAT